MLLKKYHPKYKLLVMSKSKVKQFVRLSYYPRFAKIARQQHGVVWDARWLQMVQNLLAFSVEALVVQLLGEVVQSQSPTRQNMTQTMYAYPRKHITRNITRLQPHTCTWHRADRYART